MDRAVVTKLVSHEVAKALLDCARISKTLDERESRLPIVVFGEDSDRDTIRLQREKLAAVVEELQSNALVEKVLRLAEERWPSWR
jgi:ribosomal protein L25 (general stress protein Ctc)